MSDYIQPQAYQYVWAIGLHKQQRCIALLYDACKMVMGMDKIVIMAVISNSESHLLSTSSLQAHAETHREQIGHAKKKISKQLFLDHRRERLVANAELYKKCASILTGLKPLFNPTDRRIIKNIIKDCFGHGLTCEILVEIEDEENEK